MNPHISPIPVTFPVRDLQRKYADIMDYVKESKSPALLINKSRPEAVVLDIETYNALVEDHWTYDENVVLRAHQDAMREFAQGKAKKLRSLSDLM